MTEINGALGEEKAALGAETARGVTHRLGNRDTVRCRGMVSKNVVSDPQRDQRTHELMSTLRSWRERTNALKCIVPAR